MQFPRFTSPAWRTFWVLSLRFFYFVKCSSALWCFTVNHYRPGTGMGRGGLWNLSFCQWASAHVFLRSSHRAKNLVQFLYFRKHFHNFKYNNFLFGMMPGIIHMYIWLSFICFAPLTENGLEEIRSRSWTRWGLELKSHTQRLQTGLGLVVWNSWTLIFSIFGVLTLWKRWNVWPTSFGFTAFLTRGASHVVVHRVSQAGPTRATI